MKRQTKEAMKKSTKELTKSTMQKSCISILLAMLLVCGCLTGCGQNTTGAEASVQADGEPAGSSQTGTMEQAGNAQTGTEETVIADLTVAEEAEIYVEKIDGLAEDFIKGMDASSVISQEESGVVYYNENGEEEDLFKVLADAGVNYIRVRVWNDPYDANGNGYGGGNCDVEKAAEIGRRAAQYGLKLLVDFHYSDFWADPSKQYAPKAWEGMDIEEKKTAIYEYTVESLNTIIAAGADVRMVQMGNEINYGLAGETTVPNIMELLKQASKAIREVASSTGQEIKIAVHYTGIDDYNYVMNKAIDLQKYEVDYDVFGISYYIFWHGELDWMKYILEEIQHFFDKETVIFETSYAYTLENGDGHPNVVSQSDLVDGYAATVQSQATCIRDIMAAVSEVGSLGVFYWEGAWTPVGSDAASNSALWEEYGSGWASSYSADYDPEDAGIYYGGCAWDNQAMFDWNGKPLPSLNVFKYVNAGTVCEPAIDYLYDCEVTVNMGETLVMPTGVHAVFNDRTLSGEVPVVWDEMQVAAVNVSQGGKYYVAGTLEDGTKVECKVIVPHSNLLLNPSFEDRDTSMWKITAVGSDPTDYQTKAADCTTGERSLHFWRDAVQEFRVEQTVSGLEAGTYGANANIQGGDVGDDAEIYLYVIVNGEEIHSAPVTLSGWVQWQEPEITGIVLEGTADITIGMYVKCRAGGWGTMDDFTLYKQ